MSKVRITKETLSQMPAPVRSIVAEWRAQYKKAFISVENRETFYASENARVTLIDLRTEASAHAQCAGDFAGQTSLSPTAEIPLPVGVVAIETGFFCGLPFLNLYQGAPKALAA